MIFANVFGSVACKTIDVTDRNWPRKRQSLLIRYASMIASIRSALELNHPDTFFELSK